VANYTHALVMSTLAERMEMMARKGMPPGDPKSNNFDFYNNRQDDERRDGARKRPQVPPMPDGESVMGGGGGAPRYADRLPSLSSRDVSSASSFHAAPAPHRSDTMSGAPPLDDDDDIDEDVVREIFDGVLSERGAGEAASAPKTSVPHASADAGAKKTRFISLQEARRRNFLSQFGVRILPEDEINLDHTSCSDADSEDDRRRLRRFIRAQAIRDGKLLEIKRIDDKDAFSDSLDDALDSDAVLDDFDEVHSGVGTRDNGHLSLRSEFGDYAAAGLDDDDDVDGEDASHSLKLRTASVFAKKKRALEKSQAMVVHSKHNRQRPRGVTHKSHKRCGKKRAAGTTTPIGSGQPSKKRCSSSSSSSHSGVSLGSHDTDEDVAKGGGGGGDEDGEVVIDVSKSASTMGRLTCCFMCLYGQEEYDSVNNEDMAHMYRLWFGNIGKIDNMCIALIMHRYYTDTVRPKAQCRGQTLPPQRSKQFLVCITTHNLIPEMQISNDLWNLTTICNTMTTQLISVNEKEEMSVNWKNVTEYVKALKAKNWLSYLRADKMIFNDPNRQIKMGDNKVYSRDIVLREERTVATNKAAAQKMLKQR
jgi:hypothetical protein